MPRALGEYVCQTSTYENSTNSKLPHISSVILNPLTTTRSKNLLALQIPHAHKCTLAELRFSDTPHRGNGMNGTTLKLQTLIPFGDLISCIAGRSDLSNFQILSQYLVLGRFVTHNMLIYFTRKPRKAGRTSRIYTLADTRVFIFR